MIMNKEIFQEEVNKFLTNNGEDKVIFEDNIFIESNTFDTDEITEEVSLFLNDLGLSSILAHIATTLDGYNYILLEDENKEELIGLCVMDETGEAIVYN